MQVSDADLNSMLEGTKTADPVKYEMFKTLNSTQKRKFLILCMKEAMKESPTSVLAKPGNTSLLLICFLLRLCARVSAIFS